MSVLLYSMVILGGVAVFVLFMLFKDSLGKPRSMDSLTPQEKETRDHAIAGMKHKDEILVINLNDYPPKAGFEVASAHIGQGLVKSWLEPLKKKLFDQRVFSYNEAVDPKIICEVNFDENTGGGEPMRGKIVFPATELRAFPFIEKYIIQNNELKRELARVNKRNIELEAERELPSKTPSLMALWDKVAEKMSKTQQKPSDNISLETKGAREEKKE